MEHPGQRTKGKSKNSNSKMSDRKLYEAIVGHDMGEYARRSSVFYVALRCVASPLHLQLNSIVCVCVCVCGRSPSKRLRHTV